MATTRSSIAIALNGSMVNARDIPKQGPFGQATFADVLAKRVPIPSAKIRESLPTPPNSISPLLPPHGLKARVSASASAAAAPIALDPVESDLDLHEDSTESLGSQHAFEAAGAITPALLAKHHLPDILSQGPLAIPHIMNHLTVSVPGFSGIPPAKARRLVVGALEGRGSGGEGGGINGDVRFEKIGWGRWSAVGKGQRPQHAFDSEHSPPNSIPNSYSLGMPIVNNLAGRPRHNAPSSSWAGNSAVFSHEDEDIAMLETEADKMSLDGSESCSSSENPDDDEIMADDPADITDDEDWAAVGAAALRQGSYSASGPFSSSHVYTGGIRGGGGPSLLALAKSAPMQPHQFQAAHNFHPMASDAQEREAIEALLRLGSV